MANIPCVAPEIGLLAAPVNGDAPVNCTSKAVLVAVPDPEEAPKAATVESSDAVERLKLVEDEGESGADSDVTKVEDEIGVLLGRTGAVMLVTEVVAGRAALVVEADAGMGVTLVSTGTGTISIVVAAVAYTVVGALVLPIIITDGRAVSLVLALELVLALALALPAVCKVTKTVSEEVMKVVLVDGMLSLTLGGRLLALIAVLLALATGLVVVTTAVTVPWMVV